MVTVLPMLVTGLVLAGSPAMRFSSHMRVELVVRTPNLTEREDRAVVQDLVLTPRGQVIFYTNRLELKAILEPQLLLRRAFSEPTLEVLTFLFLRGEYKLSPTFKVWALESTTYGTFPFEDFRVPAPSSNGNGPERLLDASKYVYSESLVGFDFTGLRRTYIGAMGGLVINGLLDPPTEVRPRSDRVTPAQIGPEVRAQAFHSVTRRLVMGAEVYGRDVHFSTGARLSLLQGAPVVQYEFHPLISGRFSLGLAVGERHPQRTIFPLPDTGIFHPIGEAMLTTPVPVGYHWPVKAKLSLRYAPFVDNFSTLVYPRLEGGLGFEWVGRRKAQVNVDLTSAQAVTPRFHHHDGEEKISLKFQWPLTRSSAVVASGRLLRLRQFLLSNDPIYKWFMGAGLVIRQENGRL